MECECCHLEHESVAWYTLDDNAEVQLCRDCKIALSSECAVEPIDALN